MALSDGTIKLAALVIKHDPKAAAELVGGMDFDWQAEAANDPAFEAWLDELAMTFDYSHARMPGE